MAAKDPMHQVAHIKDNEIGGYRPEEILTHLEDSFYSCELISHGTSLGFSQHSSFQEEDRNIHLLDIMLACIYDVKMHNIDIVGSELHVNHIRTDGIKTTILNYDALTLVIRESLSRIHWKYKNVSHERALDDYIQKSLIPKLRVR
jgi:hypothetical protein